jgi:DNA-binding NarL/FixJ family response regulator
MDFMTTQSNHITSILLCDDEDQFRLGLKISLNLWPKYKVIAEATNGLDAQKLITEKNPDVCIIDLSMPMMNGVSLIGELNKQNVSSRKIILSQNLNTEWLDKLIENQIDGFVLKSDGREALIKAIDTVCDGGKYFSPSVASVLYSMLLDKSRVTQCVGINLLTSKERDLAILISHGLSNRQIIEELSCSAVEFEQHRLNLMQKIAASNNDEISSWVKRCL